MRVLVCGSRHFDDWRILNNVLIPITEPSRMAKTPLTIIEGGANGADFLARTWAKFWGVAFEEYPADWEKHGKAAGVIRNTQMLEEGKPDMVVAFLSPNSRGTANMIDQATKANIPVKVINI